MQKKPLYKNIRVVFCKNNLEKAPNIRPMRQLLKIDHLAKGTAHAKAITLRNCLVRVSLPQKTKMPENAKTILKEHYSCSVQKTVRKNNKYSRNETMVKIGHLAKAIADPKALTHAKCSVWVKNLKCQKN